MPAAPPEACIDERPELQLLALVGLNIVCFRYRGHAGLSEAACGRLNQQVLAELQTRGIAVPSHTRIDGRFAIRVAFVNHRTRREDIDLLVRSVLELGREQLAEGIGGASPGQCP